MKKTLAILLALMLVFSSIPVAFAEETLPVDAQAAKDLGMLVGSGNGVTNAYLAETPNRIQAAVMFLRLKGLEETAKAFTGTDNFADADQAAWAKPIMAYLKANPELGWIGSGNNAFEPAKALDAKSYYKVMLEALGYKQNTAAVIGDFTWDNIVEFAASKGLTKVAAVTNYTNNDLATATIEALKAAVKGSEKTLAASLVDAKVLTVDAAVKAGVYTVAPAVLAVESVEAINLKETVVTFNKEVDEDSAEKSDNYLLDDEDIAGSVALNDDKKSVTITWTTNLDNQTEYDLTVADVLDAAGAALKEDVTVTFLANDVTLPVAESLTLVGPNKLKAVFSEPISVVGDVTVEDANFDYEVADVTVDGNEAIIELSDDELAEGNYSVEISAFEDYAGLKNLKKTFDLAYAKDTTAPVATIKSATQTKVVVEFNKPVYDGESGNAEQLGEDFFYHTYSSYNPVYVAASADNEEFTLYFTEAAAEAAGSGDLLDVTDRPLSEGSVKFVVVADPSGDNDPITDEWGNEVENNVTFTVSISADTTAPTVTKVEVDDQQTVLVYFSEDVDTSDATFTVLDKDGEEVDYTYDSAVDYDNADDEYIATLNFADTLEGEYSVTVEDVVDLALESNEIAKTTEKFTVADETAPDLAGITNAYGIDVNDADDPDYIYVAFPEDMATSGEYSVLNKDNYQIKVGAAFYDLKADDKITTFNGNDMVKITIDNSVTYDVTGGVELVIYRVADALGNKADDFGYAYPVIAETSPSITKVETLGEKLIEITIGGELKSVNKSYITVQKGLASADLYAIKSWEINDDHETVITGVLPSSLKLTSSSDTALTVILDDKKFETVLGTDVDTDTFSAITDGYAPSVEDDAVTKEYINEVAMGIFSVKFDEVLENVSIDTDLYAQDLIVKNGDGDVLVAGVDYTVQSVVGNLITIEITDKTDKGNYKVYSASTIKYIQDDAGNKANAFTDSVTLEDLVR